MTVALVVILEMIAVLVVILERNAASDANSVMTAHLAASLAVTSVSLVASIVMVMTVPAELSLAALRTVGLVQRPTQRTTGERARAGLPLLPADSAVTRARCPSAVSRDVRRTQWLTSRTTGVPEPLRTVHQPLLTGEL
jgi:hypothetical protein